MKTKEELNAQKEEVETLNKKLHELTDEELAQVTGGVGLPSLQTGGVTVNDGNCGQEVEIYEGKCKFHPEGVSIPNCNTTCPYYHNTKITTLS